MSIPTDEAKIIMTRMQAAQDKRKLVIAIRGEGRCKVDERFLKEAEAEIAKAREDLISYYGRGKEMKQCATPKLDEKA